MNNYELKTYLSEKIDANHEHTLALLSAIKKDTEKTNGRVNSLEDEVWNLIKHRFDHILECPQKKRVDALEEENQEMRIIKKYPKISLGILVFFVLGTLWGIYTGWSKFDATLQTITAKQIVIEKEIKKIP